MSRKPNFPHRLHQYSTDPSGSGGAEMSGWHPASIKSHRTVETARGGAINLFGCEAKWRQKGGRRGGRGESGVRARRQTIPPSPHFLSKTHRCSTLARIGRTERWASVRNGGEDLSLHPCEANKRSLWHFTGSEQTCGLPAIARELLCSSLLRERPRGFFLLLQTRCESSSRDLARSGL